MTDIVVVVLNYKTPDLAVLAAQSAAAAMADCGGAIVLVDNDSPDGSFQRMIDATRSVEWPAHLDVQVLQSGRNAGFGAGNNFGIHAGLEICPTAEFIYILNPDAQVEPNAIAALVDYINDHPKVAIAGSWVYGEDGADHCSAFRFPGLASEFESSVRLGPVTRLLKKHVLPLHIPETSGPVGWILGASMLVRRSALNEIGLFDETFFLYFEETDLSACPPRRPRGAFCPRKPCLPHRLSVDRHGHLAAHSVLLVPKPLVLLQQEPQPGLCHQRDGPDGSGDGPVAFAADH